MENSMIEFKEKESHTEIRYVIAYYMNKTWFHYSDFSEIDVAKEYLKKLRKCNPNRKYSLFEKIEQVTINKLDEEYL